MKKGMKFLALALATVLTFGFASNVNAAEDFKAGYECIADVDAAVDYVIPEDVREHLGEIVKDSIGSMDRADELEPAKSTFVAFKYSPVKVVKYDGKEHGMKANAYKTIGCAYVDKAEVLYVGITADKELYNSFDKPVEVGFYYTVAMYSGNANNYPSVAYGVIIILPACDCTPDCPKPECPNPECPDPDGSGYRHPDAVSQFFRS